MELSDKSTMRKFNNAGSENIICKSGSTENAFDKYSSSREIIDVRKRECDPIPVDQIMKQTKIRDCQGKQRFKFGAKNTPLPVVDLTVKQLKNQSGL